MPMATADSHEPKPRDPAPMPVFNAPAVWYVIAAGCTVLAFGAFFWGLSAAARSCVPCDCLYSVFATVPKCRWPAILGIVYWVFLIAALGAIVTGFRLRRRAKERGI